MKSIEFAKTLFCVIKWMRVRIPIVLYDHSEVDLPGNLCKSLYLLLGSLCINDYRNQNGISVLFYRKLTALACQRIMSN